MVCVPIYAIHRSEALWDRADEFVPERFLGDGASLKKHLIPFSVGPRRCIGRRSARCATWHPPIRSAAHHDDFASLAMMELRLTLCALLKHFTLEFGDEASKDLKPRLQFVLRPRDRRFMVRVKPRHAA